MDFTISTTVYLSSCSLLLVQWPLIVAGALHCKSFLLALSSSVNLNAGFFLAFLLFCSFALLRNRSRNGVDVPRSCFLAYVEVV